MPGNKSLMILLNKGRSSCKNLGILTSYKAFNNNISSGVLSLSYLLNNPAALITEFTARIP